MPSSPDQALARLRVGSDAAPRTKAQKAFNRWIDRIEEQGRLLAEWQGLSESFQHKVAQEHEPLRRRVQAQQLALLQRMDRIHDGDELSRRERGRLAQVLLEQVSTRLAQDPEAEGQDPVLVGLHDKYSDVGHEDLRRGEAAAVRSMVEDVLGTTLEGDLSTPEAVLRTARECLSNRSMAEEETSDPAEEPSQTGPSRDRQTRQAARTERERALAEAATQSVRDVWRRLASALHPDREPEPAERARKTALMQRVNQAYEAQDLLQLLSLQGELGEDARSKQATDGDARLLHYNRALKEQSEGLAAEIHALTARFEISLRGRPRSGWTPTSIMAALNQEIAALQSASRGLSADLEAFRDIHYVKAWLKAVRVTRPSEAPSASVAEEVEAFLAEVMLARALGVPFGEAGEAGEAGAPTRPRSQTGRKAGRKQGRA